MPHCGEWDLIELYTREVAMLEREIHRQLHGHTGYEAIQAIDGVGRTLAAIFVAEIGDVSYWGLRDGRIRCLEETG